MPKEETKQVYQVVRYIHSVIQRYNSDSQSLKWH